MCCSSLRMAVDGKQVLKAVMISTLQSTGDGLVRKREGLGGRYAPVATSPVACAWQAT